MGGKIERIRSSWYGMVKRCSNERDSAFKYYGGRGIKVCERWKDQVKDGRATRGFKNFFEDMQETWFDGEDKNAASLDRIDNDGDYTPENCRWVTRGENTRRMLLLHGNPMQIPKIAKIQVESRRGIPLSENHKKSLHQFMISLGDQHPSKRNEVRKKISERVKETPKKFCEICCKYWYPWTYSRFHGENCRYVGGV